jgi:Nif-specific regulatory protein
MYTFCDKNGRDCYGVSELPLLFGISSLLNQTRDIKEVIYPILELMGKYINAKRSMITILNRDLSRIFIEDAFGLSPEAKSKGIYKIGEGIIGEVVKTGCLIIIADISKDNRFLNKTGFDLSKNKGASFICVPIKVEHEVIGTLSIHRLSTDNFSVIQDQETLSIIGSLIAQSVKVRQDQIEEIEHLKLENDHLNQELKGSQMRPNNIRTPDLRLK